MIFKLIFGVSLASNDDGYELMKQYNQLIKYKHYLEYLVYRHDRIGGTKSGDIKQEIEELIDRVHKS